MFWWILFVLFIWFVISFGYTIYRINHENGREYWYDMVLVMPMLGLMYMVSNIADLIDRR